MRLDSHTVGLLMARPVDKALLSEFLISAGYRVVLGPPDRSTDGEWDRVSLVLVDSHTARRIGKEILKMKRGPAAFIPIVVALGPADDSHGWLRAGFDDVLRLPVSKLELAARLRVCLRYREHSVEQQHFEHTRLQEVLRQMPAGVVMADATTGAILYENTRMDTLWHRPGNESDSITDHGSRRGFKTDGSRYAPEEWPLARSIRTGEVVQSEEIEIERGDGSRATVLVSSATIRDSSERSVAGVATFVDITERKDMESALRSSVENEQRAREEAERANRLKDEFLSTVSHELRTPLNAIIGWLHLLEGGQVDKKTHDRAISTIRRNAKSQAQIIEDLLDISRVMTGKLRMELGPVDLRRLIRNTFDGLNPAAENKQIVFSSYSDPELPLVMGDADRLRQVLWNLLSNAIKFTPVGGHVDARIERYDGHVAILVRDSGIGISPEFLPYVFDRFRQADGSSTRSQGGLGLGLSIVREIVGLHGGTVEAWSSGKGEGSTFTVRLPVTAPVSSEEFDGTSSGETRSTRDLLPAGVRLLVVEDDDDSIEMLEIILRGAGADVRACRSVAEALEVLGSFEPDAILSDIGLPGEDGFELVRQVREMDRDIPALALTAFAREEDRQQGLADGFQEYLTKPVDAEALIEAIGRLLK